MLKNYLNLAWRILGRRKFFTFISLFGISFTLGILMVVLSFLQSELGTNSPLSNKDSFVYIQQTSLQRTYYDTIPTIDTIFEKDQILYDTTYTYKESGTGVSQSSLSNSIIETYLKDLPSASNMTKFMPGNLQDVYVNGIKLSLNILLSDANYWSIFDHKIIEGRSFGEEEVESGTPVIVISTETAMNYFGRKENVVNEEMFINGITYKVIGLYPNNGKIISYVSPDAVSPYTSMVSSRKKEFYFGPFNVMYLAKPNSIKQLKSDIKAVAGTVPLDHPDNKYDYKEVIFQPETYNEMYAEGIYYDGGDAEKSLSIMKLVLICLFLFFTILPTLNLINLNVSRIMDRSSEIGVRKAFGAHQGNIITQFIVENIVQTLLGSLIGFLIAWILIQIINNGGYLGNSVLSFNLKFFVYSILATLLFGVLSGFVPAYKMSKLQIVDALKENKL